MKPDETARDDYADLGLRTLTVVWSHPDGTDALVDICFDRVRRRGSAHRTFKADRGKAARASNAAGLCDAVPSTNRGAAD
ncbi:hypothetical protein TcBrA4_0138690 [Trypanosoma cruzi]|nr:hypothetical protein TcBrA4_0138690 [Trypanosoma cruzi]